MSNSLTRRNFLTHSGLIGCSLAASPLVTPMAFARAPWDTRLVVIILRGGLDGLDAVQPYGDPNYAGLRQKLIGGPEQGSLDLDGFFALHPAMDRLMPMWHAGELGFVHAVSTPYRDKRSHFDGQDLLEAGTGTLIHGARDGWLNRMLQAVPGVRTDTAYAIDRGEMQLLKGRAPVANWSPDAHLSISPQADRLMDLIMQDDLAMHAALAEARLLSSADGAGLGAGEVEDSEAMMAQMQNAAKGASHLKIADFAAKRLRQDARVAAFSLNGWDTHQAQDRNLPRALGRLSDTLLQLKNGLQGDVWKKTAVLAMTEFGRTVRENGTRGTDHGTGGVMVLAGGAVNGGKVHGVWPGLGDSDLYEGRDLMPMGDVRTQAAWVMRGLMGLERSALEDAIFPGIDLGPDPGLLL